MPRPIKNNCDYFPHDAGMRNHRKVKAIRQKYANGYAIWSMLLEYLTYAEGNAFEKTQLEFELMSGDFSFAATEIIEVVDYCINLEMLFEKDGFVYSASLNERLAPVYEKRGMAKKMSGKRWGKQEVSATETMPIQQKQKVSVTETIQIKEKKIKGNKIKEKEESNPREAVITDWFEKAKTDESLKEGFCLAAKMDAAGFEPALTEFFKTKKIGEAWQNEKDFKKHAINWAPFYANASLRDKLKNDKTNGNTKTNWGNNEALKAPGIAPRLNETGFGAL